MGDEEGMKGMGETWVCEVEGEEKSKEDSENLKNRIDSIKEKLDKVNVNNSTSEKNDV